MKRRGKGWSDDLPMQWSSTKRGKWKAGGQIADRNSELSSTVQLNPTPPSISRCLANWDKFPKANVCAKPVVRSQLRTQLNRWIRPNTCFDPSQGPRSMGQNQRASAIDHLFWHLTLGHVQPVQLICTVQQLMASTGTIGHWIEENCFGLWNT